MHAAINSLRKCCKDLQQIPTDVLDHAEEQALQKIFDDEQKLEELRCPSLKTIPRFYQRKTSSNSDSLLANVLREARSDFLQRKSDEILNEDDLKTLLEALKKHASKRNSEGNYNDEGVDYTAFIQIRDMLVERRQRFEPFFTPSIFLQLSRDHDHCIPIALFFTFVVEKVGLAWTRLQLSHHDDVGQGYLREGNLENYIFQLIPQLPQLRSLQQSFYPFYVFTAVRKFFFFLDPRRTGRIYIRDLLASPILAQLNEMRKIHLHPSQAEKNWFSTQSATRVYGAYLRLDEDNNGMLNKNELKRFGNGMLTDVFIDRLFDVHYTYKETDSGEREIDYKMFLDFVLAMDNKNTPEATNFFWKLIDMHGVGWIDGFVINYFFRSVSNTLSIIDADVPPSVLDIQDEIFDMVKPKQAGRITLEDLHNCRRGGTVISMLVDAAAFWRYDHSASARQFDEDEDDNFVDMYDACDDGNDGDGG